MEFKRIEYKEAIEFLLPLHYSGRKPSISHAFGYYQNNELVAVCTYGKPSSNSLCKGVCGEEHSSKVYELNRLCRLDIELNKPLSMFVSWTLKELKHLELIIVSYSDTAMNHNGYIYQACNFIYTGMTKRRTDKYTEGNKHSRHYDKELIINKRKVRSSKHRYIYFLGSKTTKKKYMKCLNYEIIDEYPKGVNNNYVLGAYLEPEIIIV